MPEFEHVRILIVSGNKKSGARLEQICRGKNRQITRVSTPQEAITGLGEKSSSKDHLEYHLLIAESSTPGMDAPAFFTHAKKISPDTLRVLVIEKSQGEDQTKILIKAVNQAGIHALIPGHAPDEDVSELVTHCLENWARDLKYARLEKVTTYQNKQMFGIARRLKKKNSGLNERIQALHKDREQLTAKLEAAFRQKKAPVTLAARLDTYSIAVTAQALAEQFTQLAHSAEILFGNIALEKQIEPLDVLLSRLSDSDRITGNKSGTGKNEQAASSVTLKDKIIKTLYSAPEKPDRFFIMQEPDESDPKRNLQDFILISVSLDLVNAFISLAPCTSKERKSITLEGILGLLQFRQICFGIVDDMAIDAWIASAQPGDEPFEIATGSAPVPGLDGVVTYMFETNYTNPGKIAPDGRIDFRDRGVIPFVYTDNLVAQKRPPVPGREGKSVTGELIAVDEPLDPIFLAGSGTRLSEDELSIYADVDGHPHLDPMGEISVSPELKIDGDIGFNTGNVDFNGHIIISGRVKEGFCVKGVSLTATEVEGATLELSGDLCVSDGITDTTVASVGNIYATFINNCTAHAFGDIVIQKEIIDSTLLLSGACQNPGGTILNSKICARTGVETGRIGTPASKPSTIRTGVDDHIKFWQEKLDAQLDISMTRMQDIRDDIEAIEDQDQEIYAVIAQKTREQNTIAREIEDLKARLNKEKKNMAPRAKSMASGKLKALESRYSETDGILNRCFSSHEKNLKEINKNKRELEKTLAMNKSIMLKKKGTREFDLKTGHLPVVTAQRGITQGTVIVSPNASLTLFTDQSRCKIQELSFSDEDGIYFKLDISSDSKHYSM